MRAKRHRACRFCLAGLLVTLLAATGVLAQDTDTLRLIGTLEGENIHDQFGVALGGGGDIDNDGYPDVIVGANANDDGGDAAGKAYVYFGDNVYNASADLTVTGSASDFLGGSVAVLGDVNNDGFDDFLIGASFNSEVATRAGKALLFLGGDPPDEIADLIFYGETGMDYFGCCVTGVGDLNGDGYADWAIGAYKADVGVQENTGKVHIYLGGDPPDGIADVIIPGNADGERFGFSVAGAGRFNGDIYDDLIVGAYSYDEGGNINLGRAYVYFGGQPMDALPDLVLDGEYAFDWFGATVAGGADINHDSYDDVIVGATGYDYQTFLEAGKCYVFLGGSTPDATADYTFIAQRTNDDALGSAAAIVADLNGDTFAEFIIGAEGDNEGGEGAGKIYLFTGSATPPFVLDTTFLGEESGASFGSAVANTRGWVAGYRGTFAAGAWGYSDSSGRVYVYGMTEPFVNQAPVLDPIGPKSVGEGQNLNFIVSASDPDGTIPDLIAEDVPNNASFNDHDNGTGTFDFNPDETQAGAYHVRFVASDGALADTEVVEITVTDSDCDCGVWGDVTGDGQVNPQDVTFIQQYVFFQNDMRMQPPNCPLEAGDVANCEGQVNPQDVTFIQQYVFFQNDMRCPNPCE